MALGSPYSHGIIRKTIIAFGELFSDMVIERFDDLGQKQQSIKVPIAWGPKEKWYRRLKENADLQKSDRITVPRMSFEITGYSYDPDRRLAQQSFQTSGRSKVYSPVPYNITIPLYLLTRTQEDALNLMEQILPYFAPNLNLTISIVDSPSIVTTFPLQITGVSSEDNWDTTFDDQRIIVTTLTFVAKINLYGPIQDGSVIKTAIVDVSQEPAFVTGETYTAAVNPQSAERNDTHTIIDNWTNK